MDRPICQACHQRFCAINYRKQGLIYYRTRCEHCIKRLKKIKPPNPRWQAAGYKKKNVCDRCGFRAKYSAQLLVYHVDGNLNNSQPKNLKTICQNCAIAVPRQDLPWRPGDLEPDR